MLGARLKQFREERGLTKKSVGDYLNITPEGYGHYEADNRKPTPETLSKLATLFNVTTDELIGHTPGFNYLPGKWDGPDMYEDFDKQSNNDETRAYLLRKWGVPTDRAHIARALEQKEAQKKEPTAANGELSPEDAELIESLLQVPPEHRPLVVGMIRAAIDTLPPPEKQ